MPNIQDFNTKRYEKIWLDYMKSLNLSQYDIIIAHGTSAEATLRYLESDSLQSVNKIILVDCTDLYTAGERHGRSFRYYYIAQHSNYIHLVSSSAMYAVEIENIGKELNATSARSSITRFNRESISASTRNIWNILGLLPLS